MGRMRKILLLLIVVAALGAGGYVALARNSSGSGSSKTEMSTTTTLPSPPSVCSATVCSTWKNPEPWTGKIPSVMTTVFTPFTSAPTVHAYAAWINTSTTDIALYLGYKGPGPTTLARGPQMVPIAGRSQLLAAFNSGFYEADTAAGFFTHNTLYFPMVKGAATLIQYKDGSVDIKAWDGGNRPGTDVLVARQNLSLLINDSLPTKNSSNNALWGATLHGVPAVWRTALGLDAQGNLIYVAAPSQTSHSLAILMSKLQVVRAMQLDINPAWPIFVTYANRGAKGPSLFVPNPNQVSTRFLYSSTKDFFAVFATKIAGKPQPW